MGKRSRKLTHQAILNREQQGRGLGKGASYKPWTTVQDYAGMSKCSRIKGWKTGRTHHLLSPLEVLFFYLLEWDGSVTDIREQFPLPNGVVPEGRPTISFLINRGNKTEAAIVTYAEHPAHMEAIRRYWDKQGIDVLLVRNAHINKTLAYNIEWFHSHWFNSPLFGLAEVRGELQAGVPLAQALVGEDRAQLASDFHYYVAHKQIPLDMSVPFSPITPLALCS
jgi:hypothetical protein